MQTEWDNRKGSIVYDGYAAFYIIVTNMSLSLFYLLIYVIILYWYRRK